MSSRIRGGLLAVTAGMLALAAAALCLGDAKADAGPAAASGAGESRSLALDPQPTTVEGFLTAVTKDVDAYWTKEFGQAGLPEPRVTYNWIPAGRTASSACDGGGHAMGDAAAAYCPGDDTIYISQQFASDIYAGALDHALPGSSQGYGGTVGDFAVAYIVAHEYGHQVQDELGLFEKYGGQVPTMAFELQADCYAGTWANSAYRENRLDEGDVQEAIGAALAVGDFDAGNPGHHGTPEQRAAAWQRGFESGDPASCGAYLTST